VVLPPELDAAAAKVKGRKPWATWLRELVDRATAGQAEVDAREPGER
jgi:hypothetical protein